MCDAITDWYDCRARVRQEHRKGVLADMGHDRREPWANAEHEAIVQT